MSHLEPTHFTNSRRQNLAGVLHYPETSPRGVLVVAHGMLSSKASQKHTEVCERAARAGLLALRFDFAGRGASDGALEDLTVSGEVDDLRSALARARELHAGPLAIAGSSLGGSVAVLTAAREDDVATLVTVAAPARLPVRPRPHRTGADRNGPRDRIEVAPGAWVGRGFFEDAARHDVIEAAGQVLCPWLILHGRQDRVVPVGDAETLSAANSEAELVIHPEAGHRFAADEHRRWLVDRIVVFLNASMHD